MRVSKIIQKIKGFTLIEMLMTLAIFGIVSAVVIFNYGDFNSEIVLSNTAYEMALQVREAQVYTLGVRSFGTGEDADFNSRYGVSFDMDDPKSFVFFADQDSGGTSLVCDGAVESPDDCTSCLTGSECKSQVAILRGIVIEEICVTDDTEVFNEDGLCTSEVSSQAATITFKRPDPDAVIFNVGDENSREYNNIGIKISAPNGKSRAIIVRSTGQISVENIQ